MFGTQAGVVVEEGSAGAPEAELAHPCHSCPLSPSGMAERVLETGSLYLTPLLPLLLLILNFYKS